MPVNLGNAIRVSKVIAIDVINEVKRLCFGGALLAALLFQKSEVVVKMNKIKILFL